MVERDGRRLYALVQQHSQHLSTVWPPHSGKVPLQLTLRLDHILLDGRD